jgi:hypothetical protein
MTGGEGPVTDPSRVEAAEAEAQHADAAAAAADGTHPAAPTDPHADAPAEPHAHHPADPNVDVVLGPRTSRGALAGALAVGLTTLGAAAGIGYLISTGGS